MNRLLMTTLLALAAPAAVMADSDVTINLYVTAPGYAGDPQFVAIDEGRCADLTSDPIEGPAYVWAVISREGGFSDHGGLAAVQFGITWDDVAMEGWAVTQGNGVLAQHGEFPASGGGTGVSWPIGAECYQPEESARIGFFVVADGSHGTLQLTPFLDDRAAGWLDCQLIEREIPVENLGGIDLAIGSEPVCATATPTDEVSWAAVKALYQR